MNDLSARWARGDVAIGGWCTLGSALAAEALSRAGFHYVVVDTQHGIADYSSTVPMLSAIDCGEAVAIVRVPWNEPGIIGKMLDAGADGLIIPMVNSADEARAAVAACRYAPQGSRSYGPVRASLRGDGFDPASANEHVVCIPMIETATAVAAIDEILSVPGIDAVYVGPADLSLTLGLPPGNPDDDERFAEALATIVAACRRHGVIAGIHSTSALCERRIEQGFRMVTTTADLAAMREGMAAGIALAAGGGRAPTGSEATAAGGAHREARPGDPIY